MYRILIVEDDATIAAALQKQLAAWGFEAQHVEDFEGVLTHFTRFAPHLVLLDISLPFKSGFYWCGQIRAVSSVPIIFLSSAADNMSQVTALHQGADDFIAKPFDVAVLIAKVQAMLRRTYDLATPGDRLNHCGAELDLADACLYYAGQRISLTRNEARILQLLLEQKGHIVSREAIMRRLWDDESFIDDNTLTVNVTRLRKKLEDAGLASFITTKKGQGYIVEVAL